MDGGVSGSCDGVLIADDGSDERIGGRCNIECKNVCHIIGIFTNDVCGVVGVDNGTAIPTDDRRLEGSDVLSVGGKVGCCGCRPYFLTHKRERIVSSVVSKDILTCAIRIIGYNPTDQIRSCTGKGDNATVIADPNLG